MPYYVLAVLTGIGPKYQLATRPRDERHAHELAGRAARLFGRIADPDVWDGGRVVATDARSGQLVAVARIVSHRQ